MKRFSCLPLLSASLITLAAHAGEQNCQEASADCVPIGQWEVSLGIGLGVHSNPLVDGDEVPIVLLPDFSYYGERLFLDDYQLGYTLFDTEHHVFNAIVTASYDQIYFEDWGLGNFAIENATITRLSNDPPVVVTPTPAPDDGDTPVVTDSPTGSDREPNISPDYVDPATDPNNAKIPEEPTGPPAYDVHSRHMAGLAGFEYGYFNGPWSVNLLLLQDFTGVHDGQEARLSLVRGFRAGKNRFDVAAGLIWQSDRFLDYYYGVDEDEVSVYSGIYEANSGVTPFVRADWRRKLSNKWSFQATLHYKALSPEITDSPIVEDSGVVTVFVGGVYHF